jgi:hypothetical protein
MKQGDPQFQQEFPSCLSQSVVFTSHFLYK